MSNSNQELFDDLFAYRVYLQDIYSDENIIIIKLKKKIQQNYNYSIEDINNLLYLFYESFNINISLEQIQNISHEEPQVNFNTVVINNENINNATNLINLLNNIINNYNQNNNENNNNDDDNNNDENDDDDDDDDDVDENNDNDNNDNNNNNNENEFHNYSRNMSLNLIYNFISLSYPSVSTELNDVVVTLDNEDLNNLKTIILDKDLDDTCSICMSNYLQNESIIELPCKHFFHCDCIKTYLNKYNYKCPICRHDVGKHKYNI
jgi:hypothetical protein